MKQTNLDALNNHLFETIEMLKNNGDPNASENEKIELETAKAIMHLGKVIVEGFKVKALVFNTLIDSAKVSTNSYHEAKALAKNWGVTDEAI